MSAAAVNIRLGLSIGDYQQGFAAASAITGQFTSEFKSQFDGLKRSADAPAGAFGELGRQLSVARRQIQDVLATGGTVSTDLSNRYRLLQGSVSAVQEGIKPPTPALTGYALLNQRLTETRTKMQDLLATGRPVPQALSAEYKKLETQVNQVNGAFGRSRSGIGGLLGPLTSYAAGFLSVSAAVGILTSSLGVVSDLQRTNSAIKAVSTSTGDYANTQAFLQAVSDRYAVSLQGLSDAYVGFKANTNDTILRGAEAERIFLAVTKASAALQLKTEDTTGVLRAFGQMLSKGTVQSEELKGQVGERLYNAFGLAARAMGVTTKELNKLLQSGEVLAVDLLPKLGIEIEKTFGANAINNVDTMAGGFSRATDQLKLFTSEFSQTNGIDSFFSKITNGFADSIRAAREAQKLGKDSGYGALVSAFNTEQGRILDNAARTRTEFPTLPIEQQRARLELLREEISKTQDQYEKSVSVPLFDQLNAIYQQNRRSARAAAVIAIPVAAVDIKSLQKEQSALAEAIANANINGQATDGLQRKYDALTARIDAATASTKRQSKEYKEQAGAIEINNRILAERRKQLESNTIKGTNAADYNRFNAENKELAREIALLELDIEERKKRIDLINKPVLTGKDVSQIDLTSKIKSGLDPILDGLKTRLSELRSFGSSGFLQGEVGKIQGIAANGALNFQAPSEEAIAKLRQYTLLLRQAEDAVQLQSLQANSLNGFEGPNFDAVAKVVGQLRTMKDTINLSVGEITESLKSQKLEIVGAVSGLFSGIGESIGRGQNPLKTGLQYILNILGDYAIKIGTAALISSTALLAAAPFLAGATLPQGIGLKLTGAGLILAGGVVKGLAATAFANGGIVYGPTLGLMGEYSGARNNPEVIAPLDRLQSIIGGRGGTQAYIPELRMSYDAIYVAFKKGEEAHQYLS